MTNYVIKHSDPAAGSFLIQSEQIDGTSRPGNAALYTNPVSGLTAVSANTSLVLAGQGIVDYGEFMQNNLVYLMEHFAYATRPLSPVQGQIWYKNAAGVDSSYPSDPQTVGLYLWTGSTWTPIITGAGGVLDMGGARVANVGNAVSGGDAVSRNFGDARYLQTAGGNTTGAIVATSGSWTFGSGVPVSISAAPTTGLHATNKSYVDGLLATETTARTTTDTSLQNQINTLSGSLGSFIVSTGDTMTGTLTFDTNASLFFTNGTGAISFGLRRLQQIADPVANTDATSRFYVDTAISTAIAGVSGGGASDGVVNAGSFDDTTGVLSLQRTNGLPDVVVAGNMSPLVHAHSSGEVTYDFGTPYSRSYLANAEVNVAGYPVIRLDQLMQTIDQTLNDVTRRVQRQILIGDGTTTTFALGDSLSYIVDDNRLQVYISGVKQIASEHGRSKVVFTDTNIGLRSLVPGLSAAPRSFTLTVDGGVGDVVTITPVSNYTYQQMFAAIQAALTSGSVPVYMRVTQYTGKIELEFVSHTAGSGSSVTTSHATGELFNVITTAGTPIDKAITVNYSYHEVGNVGTASSSITFDVAPPNTAVIEVLNFPL